MAKHTKFDMLVAKGENMNLVILLKYASMHHWEKSPNSYPPNNDRVEAFLCLPEHEEACLASLNGDPIEIRSKPDKIVCENAASLNKELIGFRTEAGEWVGVKVTEPWNVSGWYMSEMVESRAVPIIRVESSTGADEHNYKSAPAQPQTLVEKVIENMKQSKKEMALKK
ncbi:hypothetical protein [Vibrio crassostreae]|uniref:hypothetical protein n=1 Tax=Vibrio crassostreae TaxID=246167 RepID=UPI001B317292|nr:hypothetical protein [Vibrio crassostreae]